MKSETYIQRHFKNQLACVIDEPTTIAIGDGGESFAEIFGVREPERNCEFARLVDVAPLAWVSNQANVRNSGLADVDCRQTLRKVVNQVKLWLDDDSAGFINEGLLFADRNQSQAFMEFIRTVKLERNNYLPGVIDEPPLAIFLDREEFLRFSLLAEGGDRQQQNNEVHANDICL